MDQGLLRIVYTSRASAICDQKAVAAIIATARAHNASAQISGQLVFEQGIFAQWLEGPAGTVEKLWSKLQHDPRHYGVQLVSACKIEQRSFPQWSMAITSAQPELISHVQGVVNQGVAELPAILNFPDQILRLFDLLADVQSLNRRRSSAQH